MTLLYKTNIDKLVGTYINGRVARIGGGVDQLLIQKNASVQDFNILDGGFGSTKSISQGVGFSDYLNIIKRKFKQEIKHLYYGNRVPLDRTTIQLDMHFAQQSNKFLGKFDSVISSNVLEHSPNLIFFLLNFHFVGKEDGYQFHALPNYRYTYDRFRNPTQLEHFIHDFECHQSFDDKQHNEDYIQSAIDKDGWQKDFHRRYPVAYPYMHFHVFDEFNTLELFEFMFEEVTVDVIRDGKFSDNLVFFRNKLNKSFSDKYFNLIEEVKNGKYLP